MPIDAYGNHGFRFALMSHQGSMLALPRLLLGVVADDVTPPAFTVSHDHLLDAQVAGDLLGRILCRRLPGGRVLRGRLLEVEAYDGPEDLASHATRGLTKRNAPMYGPPGHLFVYLIYGLHHCFNIVTEREGFPAAVLIRTLEPLEDIEKCENCAVGDLTYP